MQKDWTNYKTCRSHAADLRRYDWKNKLYMQTGTNLPPHYSYV